MRKLLTSFIFLTVGLQTISAQSAKSDSLFAEGVRLYNAGRFQKAIPYFSESDCLDKVELDSTSNRKDYSQWWLASCYYHLGDSARASFVHKSYNVEPVDRSLTIVSDSLTQIAEKYFDSGDYQNALAVSLQAADIEKGIVGELHPFYGNTLFLCSYLEAALGNMEEAISMGSDVMRIFKNQIGNPTNAQIYAQILVNLISYHSALGNDSIVVSIGAEAIEAQRNFFGVESGNYLSVLDNLSVSYSNLGLYAEAINNETEALLIREKMIGKDTPDYVATLENLAYFNFNIGNGKEAVRLGNEIVKTKMRLNGEDNKDFALSLSNLAEYYFLSKDYLEAIHTGELAMSVFTKIAKIKDPAYIKTASNLALYNFASGNFLISVNWWNEALKLQESLYGKDNHDYTGFLHGLARTYARLGDYVKAVCLMTEAKDINERICGIECDEYAASLRALSEFNMELGDYDSALRFGDEAYNIISKGNNLIEKAWALDRLAICNRRKGNYSDAITLEQSALQIIDMISGKENVNYAELLSSLASLYSDMGNNPMADYIQREVLFILEKTIGKTHPGYATELNNLSLYTINLTEAKQLLSEALTIYEKAYGKDHPYYATLLSNMASILFALGNHEEAFQIEKQSLDVRKKSLGGDHPYCASSLKKLATYCYRMHNYGDAIKYATEALHIREKSLGKDHPDYASLLEDLSLYYYKKKDFSSYSQCVIEATYYNESHILRNFAGLTSSERNFLWNKYSFWFNCLINQSSYRTPTDSIVECALNGTLLSKGLLLNSETELKKMLMESGDQVVLDTYKELKENQETLDAQYKKTINERLFNTDSLRRQIEQLERNLVISSKTYGDYTKNLRIKWKDVQSKLGKKDIAIEFVAFPLTEDSIMYVAYITKNGMVVPKMVPLFEEKQLKKELEKLKLKIDRGNATFPLYNSTIVSCLVWKPLEKYLEGVKNVYFAPSGELYNVSIELLPHWDGGGRISDRWVLYRLSSTRQLALIKDKDELKTAIVYGGLKYNTDTTTIVNNSKKYRPVVRSIDFFVNTISDSLNLRVGVKELPATKVEAEHIDSTLRKSKINDVLYLDTLGTEASFKNLSGQKSNILHIATHGFYWTENETKYMDNLSFLRSSDNNHPRYVEDKAMIRSGLFMAGANNALMGKKLPEGVDDGILTAKEISQLDLRGLDLVVLSACQTGVGEIKGDGVFGLQRGFKKSGANTLMMSLWQVDDNATQILMTRFYSNLFLRKNPETGKAFTKLEALREAQTYVREYEVDVIISDTLPNGSEFIPEMQRAQASGKVRKVKRYKDPYYWAAFILLDALD